MKKIDEIGKILKDKDLTKKIQIIFGTKDVDDDFDPYSKNYTYLEKATHTIRGLVKQLSPEALVWKQYGLAEIGAVEIIVESKYQKWFENCVKVIIDSQTYTVFKDATGDRALIQKRSNDVIRVILKRK